jgi:hypothetical protein
MLLLPTYYFWFFSYRFLLYGYYEAFKNIFIIACYFEMIAHNMIVKKKRKETKKRKYPHKTVQFHTISSHILNFFSGGGVECNLEETRQALYH